jgi:hypothetical protein
MKQSKKHKQFMADFILYSYQCNPIHIEVNAKHPSINPEFDEQCNREADEAMARHQELIGELFNTPEIRNFKKDDSLFFLHRGNYYGGKILLNSGGIIMLRLQRTKVHEYELNYQIVTHREEPSSLIIIDNRHEQQRILIENSKNTFKPKTIASILERNLANQLIPKRVGIRIPLIYRKDKFWDVVSKHERGIKQLVFDFPYPNMARPMEKLGASLKRFGVDLKGKVRIVTTAQRKDYLVISPKERNEDLDEIVSYLFEVGSPVDIHLISGHKVKCFSKDNPIVINVKESIAKFRGQPDNTGRLFDNGMFEAVAELLNTLKGINYPQEENTIMG